MKNENADLMNAIGTLSRMGFLNDLKQEGLSKTKILECLSINTDCVVNDKTEKIFWEIASKYHQSIHHGTFLRQIETLSNSLGYKFAT